MKAVDEDRDLSNFLPVTFHSSTTFDEPAEVATTPASASVLPSVESATDDTP
jgi:hypothetical protein